MTSSSDTTAAGDQRLQVSVRLKPLPHDQKSSIKIVDERSLVVQPERALSSSFSANDSRSAKSQLYKFDRVFDGCATNRSIYETVNKPMLEAAIDGVNCCVLAYGATNSGKSHTMFGDASTPGLVQYTASELFTKFTHVSVSDPLPGELRVSFCEIRNEKVRDLLASELDNSGRPSVKRLKTSNAGRPCTPKRTSTSPAGPTASEATPQSADSRPEQVPNVSYHTPRSAKQLTELIKVGRANRYQHSTEGSAKSGRSHAILQVLLTRRTRRLYSLSAYAKYETRTSKVSFVDLASSRSPTSGQLAGKDSNTDKSLNALNFCISALADRFMDRRRIPYNFFKLTELLEDSLDGRGRTVMIATVSQRTGNLESTQGTLALAAQARRIKLRPVRNLGVVAMQSINFTVVEEVYRQEEVGCPRASSSPHPKGAQGQTQVGEATSPECSQTSVRSDTSPVRVGGISSRSASESGDVNPPPKSSHVNPSPQPPPKLSDVNPQLQPPPPKSNDANPSPPKLSTVQTRIEPAPVGTTLLQAPTQMTSPSPHPVYIKSEPIEPTPEPCSAGPTGGSTGCPVGGPPEGSVEAFNFSVRSVGLEAAGEPQLVVENPNASHQWSRWSSSARTNSLAAHSIRIRSANPDSNEFLKMPTLPCTKREPGSVIDRKPSRKFEKCPGNSVAENLVEKISFHNSSGRRIMFKVLFVARRRDGSPYESWIDLQVLDTLAPRWKLLDYMRSLYLFLPISFNFLYAAAKRKFGIDLLRRYISEECRNARRRIQPAGDFR